MDGHQTLRDFVLELLTDPQARAAFELDPEGSLQAAGLSDLTPADVQDVIPLVADLVPAQGAACPVQFPQNLGPDLLPTDTSAAISQLQHITDQLPIGTYSANSDINVAALGAVTASPAGAGFGGSLFAPAAAHTGADITVGTSDATAGLSSEHDVSGTLDADLSTPGQLPVGTGGDGALLSTADGLLSNDLTGTVTSVLGGVGGDLGGPLGLDTVTGQLDSVLGGAGGVTGGLEGTLSGAGAITGDLDGTVQGATSITGDLGSTLGVGHITGDLGLGGDAHASGTGMLGLGDGLL